MGNVTFKLGQIPVEISGSFWLMCLFGAAAGTRELWQVAVWTLVVLVSITIHELGHAIAFRRYGHSPSIEIYALGGVTRGTAGVKTSTKMDLVIALAGPVAGFVVGGAALLVAALIGPIESAVGSQVLTDLQWVNIGWGVFNLLPLYPLDGGLALSAGTRTLWPARGERIGLSISLLTAIAVVILALRYGQSWIAMIAAWAGITTYQALARALRRGEDARFDAQLADAFEHLAQRRPAAARALADEIIAQLRVPALQKEWMEVLAWAHIGEDHPEQALRTLEALPPGLTPSAHVLAIALGAIGGREAEAAEAAARAYAESPTADRGRWYAHALLAAKDYAGAHALAMGARSSVLDDRALSQIEVTLFHAGQFRDALDVSNVRFQSHGSADAAYNAACSAARLNDLDTAVTWLRTAFQHGYDDRAHLAVDADLAAIRDRPEVRALIEGAPETAA